MADPTIIDAGTRIDGRIAGDADVTVRGRVDGEIELSEALTVAEGGLVSGRINVREVIVEGAVEGDIAAGERIFLTATARVVGTLEAPAIQMADGAQFAGEVLMELEGAAAPARTSRPASTTTTRTTTSRTAGATTRPVAGTTTRPYEANATRPVATSGSTTTTTVVEEEAEEEPEAEAAGGEASEAEEPAITELSKPELEDYTVKELREELRERDLQVSGTKDELIERLQQAGD
ncbi:MAG: polymer-forming cytoskeletal protein [Persicimonas sp.]